MNKIGIVTDSTSCLPEDLINKYAIRVVPAGFSIDNKPYRDRVDISNDEFWRLFKKAKHLPTTSAIAPGEFTNTFSDLIKDNDCIVCILVSKALSAIQSSAQQAKEMFKAQNPNLKIEIIDSKNSTGALGFIVLEAARVAQNGGSLEQVIRVANNMIPRVKFICVLDTLKYLIQGGRAPKIAYIGELLQVKPFIGMVNNDGLVGSLGKERGKEKALFKMVEMVKDYTDVHKPLHLMVHYSDKVDRGVKLKQMVIERYSCSELYMTPFTPVMSCHTGPALSLSFYS
jgi:DegV family protein with EDD domain